MYPKICKPPSTTSFHNCEKNGCMKLDQKLIGCEHAYLNDKKIECVHQIKYLENYIDRSLNDIIDCTHHYRSSK